MFTTDNGAENFTWPDGGQTPFAGGKGTASKAASACPAIVRWPGKVPAGKVENGIISGLDWFPTFVAAAGDPNIVDELMSGQAARRPRPTRSTSTATTRSTSSPARARRSATRSSTSPKATLGAVRIDDYKYRFTDQPGGWLGNTVKLDWPILTNLRLDPFERTEHAGAVDVPGDWYVYEFWRFVFVQQEVAQVRRRRFVDFPPMQKAASFNLEAVKEQILAAIKAQAGRLER